MKKIRIKIIHKIKNKSVNIKKSIIKKYLQNYEKKIKRQKKRLEKSKRTYMQIEKEYKLLLKRTNESKKYYFLKDDIDRVPSDGDTSINRDEDRQNDRYYLSKNNLHNAYLVGVSAPDEILSLIKSNNKEHILKKVEKKNDFEKVSKIYQRRKINSSQIHKSNIILKRHLEDFFMSNSIYNIRTPRENLRKDILVRHVRKCIRTGNSINSINNTIISLKELNGDEDDGSGTGVRSKK